ncbi:hypothetical protein GH714_018574 [Hevea brasiliensis]|uniref:type I protein arginine methyltransferase n=1 Tax=Hevea brasiliensis TaxID=3981 RepID=A0A6A6MJG1_HEVBR|nr:hypothetical protein GH714_018574 [Hevea brasiliensis]
MEVSAGQKLKKQQQLALASITELYPSSSSCLASPVVARYSADNGVVELRFLSESDATDFIDVDLSTAQLFKLGPDRSVCIYEDLASDTSKEAGAKHVYTVEASEMAEYAHKLIAGNPSLGNKGKVKEVELPEKADILISEPMGTLLVNERMLESYVIARDQFLLPSGKMFPTVGRDVERAWRILENYRRICNGKDEVLGACDDSCKVEKKALFWQQQNYYRVDLTPVYGSAFQGCFSQPVVDAFDPRLLVAPAMFHVIDFTEIKEFDLLSHFFLQEAELYEIDIPLKFKASVGARVHGLACWFDVLFNGVMCKGGLRLPPVLLQPTGINYAVFCLSHSMPWQDKKLLAGSTWLRTMLRVIPYI